MNVVSYFDGMSCGQVALERSGISADNYFAYEIDAHAIRIAQHNYPNTEQMGSVLDVDFESLPEIDLLIGGSPCQSFSIAGNGSGFDGKSGLFWEYARALKEINPKYFLLENVKPQKKEWLDVINKELGCESIIINSSLVSAQKRKRHFWTSIPNITQPVDKGVIFEDIVEYGNTTTGLYLSEDNIEYGKKKHAGKVWKSGI